MKMKIKENVAYWCKTEKLAKEFLKECDEQGIEWATGKKATEKTNYGVYENTYYIIRFDMISYGSVDDLNKQRTENQIVEYKGKTKKRLPTLEQVSEDARNEQKEQEIIQKMVAIFCDNLKEIKI